MKSFVQILFIALVILQSCSIKRYTRLGYYRELNGTEYQKYVNDSVVNIIDVRTINEYKKSHIAGAKNASYIGGDFKEIVDSLALNKEIPTLIYCETQHRSLFATKKLVRMGFKNIIDLDKGMIAWRKDGFPFIEAKSQ